MPIRESWAMSPLSRFYHQAKKVPSPERVREAGARPGPSIMLGRGGPSANRAARGIVGGAGTTRQPGSRTPSASCSWGDVRERPHHRPARIDPWIRGVNSYWEPAPTPSSMRLSAPNSSVARRKEAPLSQVAHDFGISESCLHRWVKRAEIEEGVRDGLTLAEEARSVS